MQNTNNENEIGVVAAWTSSAPLYHTHPPNPVVVGSPLDSVITASRVRNVNLAKELLEITRNVIKKGREGDKHSHDQWIGGEFTIIIVSAHRVLGVREGQG